jgi:hypothetical protein
MKIQTKLIIGGGLVLGSGLAVYAFNKTKNVKPRFVIDKLVLDNKDDLKKVIEEIDALSKKYDSITVGDYYDLMGVGSSYIANSHGWKSEALSKVKIKKVRGGYTIIFPPVEVL